MPVSLTQLHTLSDLHVFIRPLLVDTIVLGGIVTRQHQDHERMSTGFCTHVVLSNSKADGMDRLGLGAELTDYVVFLDKARMMMDGITIYRVSEVTFVATGPIPPACAKGVYQSVSDGFMSVYVSSLGTRPNPEREMPARGRGVEPRRASGSHAPARTPVEHKRAT